MGISRPALARYFGETITLSGTLSEQTSGRFTLLLDLNKEREYITDHLWIMLPKHHLRPGARIRVRGVVSKYTREVTLTESYGLKRVEFDRFGFDRVRI